MLRIGASVRIARDYRSQPPRLLPGHVCRLLNILKAEMEVRSYVDEPWDEGYPVSRRGLTLLFDEMVGTITHPHHLLRPVQSLHTDCGVVRYEVISPFVLDRGWFPCTCDDLGRKVPETRHMTILRGSGWEATRQDNKWVIR